MVRNLYLIMSTEQARLDSNSPIVYHHHVLAESVGTVGETAIMHMYNYIIGHEVMAFKSCEKDYFKDSGRLYHCFWAFSADEAFKQAEEILK